MVRRSLPWNSLEITFKGKRDINLRNSYSFLYCGVPSKHPSQCKCPPLSLLFLPFAFIKMASPCKHLPPPPPDLWPVNSKHPWALTRDTTVVMVACAVLKQASVEIAVWVHCKTPAMQAQMLHNGSLSCLKLCFLVPK